MTQRGKADIIQITLYTIFLCWTSPFLIEWGRNMKRILTICMILCLMIYSIVTLAFASPIGVDSTSQEVMINSCHGLDATGTLLGSQKLLENAKAAFLYEATSDTVMYELNADEKMHPASLVKIMTAFMAVRRGELTDLVVVTEDAISSLPIDAVSSDLVPGEQISLKDLLYCLLVGSANDAAAVIAEHISGSQPAFVQQMNQYAKEIGCTGTQFTNAHGLHNADQYTTARDVVKILSAAMKNDVFRSIFTSVKYTVSATNKSEERSLGSNNSLMDTGSALYYDSRVIGGRTGVTEDGRRCIATAAESNGMLLLSVVMGAETTYQEDGYSAIRVGGYHETSALLNAGFNGNKSAQILFANQVLEQWDVVDGNNDVVLGSKVSVSVVLPDSVTSADLTLRYADVELRAPISAGQKVSTVQIWYGNMCVAEADLYAMNSVDLTNSVKIEKNVQSNNGLWITALWIILAVVGGVAVIIISVRSVGEVRSFLTKMRTKRYRRSRRRSH